MQETSVQFLGRFPGGEHGNPLQYAYLENPYGQSSPPGYSPWGYKESDTTAGLSTGHVTLGKSLNIFCFFSYVKNYDNKHPFSQGMIECKIFTAESGM